MSLSPELINYLRKVKNFPKTARHELHKKWPQVFGLEVTENLVQFYRNDDVFRTMLSFNHFIEFFSQNKGVSVRFKIQAYKKNGHPCGTTAIDLHTQGVRQVFLDELFPQLDTYGIISVNMVLTPKYHPDLKYLGALSAQFMTVYAPKDQVSAPQMVHSHKRQQGYLPFRKKHPRLSSHFENIRDSQVVQFYVLNSSHSSLITEIKMIHPEKNTLLLQKDVEVPGYGCCVVELNRQDLIELNVDSCLLHYDFNRSVDHKKPIIFRKTISGSWSCNHT